MRAELLLAVALAACAERPDVRIVCHNGNCAEPQDPSNDDTVAALHASLALGFLDGVELDLVVHDGGCWFAHDTAHAGVTDIADAARIVADHIRTRDSSFIVELELKATAAIDTSLDCALVAHEVLRDAAAERGLELDVMLTSYAPAMLRAAARRRPADTALVRTRVALGIGVPGDNHRLSELDDVPLDIVEIHPGWITDTALRALRSQDVEVGAWFLDMNRETLDGLDRLRPTYVLVGQAESFRRWLDR